MVVTVGASASYTPGNQACATLVSQIKSFVQAPDDDEVTTLALAGMNAGIDLINSRTWKKINGSADIDLVAGTSRYGLESDFKDPLYMFLLDSSGNRVGRLPFQTEVEFWEGWDNRSSSTGPCRYTVDYASREFVLDYAPASGYVTQYPQYKAHYHRRIPKLTCTGTTGLPPEFDSFLVARGAVWLARIREPDRVRDLMGEATERWRMLTSDDGNIQTDY